RQCTGCGVLQAGDDGDIVERGVAKAQGDHAGNLAGSRAGYGVTTPTIRTTSKALPWSCLSRLISLSFQRASATPLRYQSLPLSATIIPYFCRARRMTCT